MKKLFLLLALALALPVSSWAQDDVYFSPGKESKAEKSVSKSERPTYYSGSNRDVDEYNRGGRISSFYQKIGVDSMGNDIVTFPTRRGVGPDSTYIDTAYVYPVNRGYDDDDYAYTRHMSRWDGYYSPWYGYYGPWSYYYGSPYWYGYYGGWYDPWYDPWYYGYYSPWYYGYYGGWYDPWYWGGYYRPYYAWGGPVYYGGRNSGGYTGARTWNGNNGRNVSSYGYNGRSSRNVGNRSFGSRTYTPASNGETRSYGGYSPSRSAGFGGGMSSGGFGGGHVGGGSFGGHAGGGGGFSGGGHFGGGRR